MTFRFDVAVKVKNDGLTQDCERQDLFLFLAAAIESRLRKDTPWVLEVDVRELQGVVLTSGQADSLRARSSYYVDNDDESVDDEERAACAAIEAQRTGTANTR